MKGLAWLLSLKCRTCLLGVNEISLKREKENKREREREKKGG